MRFSPLLDLPLRMGSGCRTAQQHAAGGCVRPLHGASVQSSVPGLRAARVHLQRLLNMDRVQVEEHQWTHLPGGQSRPGGEFISACRQSPLEWHCVCTHTHTCTRTHTPTDQSQMWKRPKVKVIFIVPWFRGQKQPFKCCCLSSTCFICHCYILSMRCDIFVSILFGLNMLKLDQI